MPKRQFNKLSGLKKLRLIAKEMSGRVSVAPFKVYDHPAQFHQSHVRGRPRLLVRTDEKGREFKHLDWNDLPRSDVPAHAMQSPEKVRNFLDSLRKYSPFRSNDRVRFIVHPTFMRGEVAQVGSIQLHPSKESSTRISIGLGDGNYRESEFFGSPKVIFFFRYENGRFKLEKGKIPKKFVPIVRYLLAFVRAGINSRQLNLNRDMVAFFNSWKDAPEVPEFYDLKEYREMQPRQKRKNRKGRGK